MSDDQKTPYPDDFDPEEEDEEDEFE